MRDASVKYRRIQSVAALATLRSRILARRGKCYTSAGKNQLGPVWSVLTNPLLDLAGRLIRQLRPLSIGCKI